MPIVRLASPSDLTQVETIVRQAYSGYIPRIGQKPRPMLDDYAALIDHKQVHVLEDDGIVGVLVLIPELATMLLDNIAVALSAQGKAYRRLLLDFAEQEARRQGFEVIRLYTHVLMTENLTLYPRLGYVATHRGEEKGFQRVYMAKRLLRRTQAEPIVELAEARSQVATPPSLRVLARCAHPVMKVRSNAWPYRQGQAGIDDGRP